MQFKWLPIVLILLLAGSGWARRIDTAGARQAGLNWLRRVPQLRAAHSAPKAAIRPLRDREQQQTLAYVQELEPQGFILIAADERLQPILGFSSSAPFDTTESPENHLLLLIRHEMPFRLRALEENRVNAAYLARAEQVWETLRSAPPALQAEPAALAWTVEAGPMLTSRWSQGSDYTGHPVFNYYTPNNWVCGCVATAMSQVLYYHRWPASGTGAHSYTWEGELLSADFSATAYAWNAMVDNYYTPGNEPLVNRQAAGMLTWQTGVSVEMDYAVDGSGAMANEVASSLSRFFRHHGEWVDGSEAGFFDRLYDNMLLGRPALFAIYTADNQGHAIVVDGVRHESGGTRYYHLNLGWGGAYDAWYDLSGPWTTGSYTWTTIAGAVLDILPLQALDDPGEEILSPALELSWSNGANYSPDLYELQQARIDPALTAFNDGAESGAADWLIDGHWKQSTSARHAGSSSFQGHIAETESNRRTFLILQLDRTLRIGASTQITYNWGAFYFHNTAARLEISTDLNSWQPLRTHTSTATSWPITWQSVSVSAAELAGYVGQMALLRFVIDLTGNSWYYSPEVGFYLDDFRIQNAALGEWTVVDAAIAGRAKSLSFTQSGDYAWRVRSYWNSQWWPWSDVESATVELPETASLQLRAFLQGAYSGNRLMRSDLREQGAIPLASPYAQAPAVLSAIPAGAVDWVLLQLYEADGITLTASVSAFLRSDGQLVDTSGAAPLILSGIYRSKAYHIALRHRNHVAVMSAAAKDFSSGVITCDFTAGIGEFADSSDAVLLEEGVWGLWAGDSDQDSQVGLPDFELWQTAATQGRAGYHAADLNLDGQVTTADYIHWYNNGRALAAGTE